MRLIDADALSERLREHAEGKAYIYASGVENARMIVEAAPTMGEWISVKDRLPEGKGELYADCELVIESSNSVLVYGNDPYDDPCFGIACYVYDHRDKTNKGWDGTLGADWDASLCEITHWMPLPKPPEEGT